ncbi:MepB family protein [Shewanella donghaensis]|uniref:MepB family protein n=1 Tax=Shewanella donghaensis TaxID=238836 RepID=UPI001D036C3D|nr:MepB family protein [Shewanella donghaensis]
MLSQKYRDELESLLIKGFTPAGYNVTKNIELDPIPESAQYGGLTFSINDHNIIYRKGKVTADRPGAFLAIWQRPSPCYSGSHKPIPYSTNDLDFLFVQVEAHSVSTNKDNVIEIPQSGLFIFPVSLLVKKGIISTDISKGKTGFRVFPPWSDDRGEVGTQVFSASGRKTQRWQLPYFIEIDENSSIDAGKLTSIITQK